jgi:hypothetical protein
MDGFFYALCIEKPPSTALKNIILMYHILHNSYYVHCIVFSLKYLINMYNLWVAFQTSDL